MVLLSDAALDRLVRIYDRARGEAAECAAVLTLIGPSRLPQTLQNWDAINRATTAPPVAILEPWRAALSELEAGNVDVVLPTLTAAA